MLESRLSLAFVKGKRSVFLFSPPNSDAKDRLLPIRSLFAPLRLKSWAGKEKGWSSVDEKKKKRNSWSISRWGPLLSQNCDTGHHGPPSAAALLWA